LVAADVQIALAPPLRALEGALATTDFQIHAYDNAFTAGTAFNSAGLRSLVGQTVIVLAAQANVCVGISHAFSALSFRQLAMAMRSQLAALREDLILFSLLVTAMIQKTSVDVARMPRFLESPAASAYPARVAEALPILRRAEAWLDVIDHETGAHATLPGFAPGALPIETQLGLQ
jgi:hypothetical protein